jgi:hypothetical protein
MRRVLRVAGLLCIVIGAIATISPWDLLWFALAGVSAWKIGSGASGIMGS